MIGYIFALLPLYVLVYLPLQRMFYGSGDVSTLQATSLNASLIASDEPLSCPSHSYNTFVVSREPLIIYVENFLSPEESQHLLDIRYLPSTSPPLLFPTFPPWALSMRETRD
jgi:prolyl 4-hydroxylase